MRGFVDAFVSAVTENPVLSPLAVVDFLEKTLKENKDIEKKKCENLKMRTDVGVGWGETTTEK